MDNEPTKTRSPNAPKIPLAVALTHTEELYKKAGRSAVGVEGAALALGFKGVTGSSMTLLGALNQYGLVERSKGIVKISPLALRIMKPVSDEDRLAAIREAALSPSIFSDINENHADLNQEVLSHQLEHQGFAAVIASRIASAFKSNFEFAKLGDAVSTPNRESVKTHDLANKIPSKGAESAPRGLWSDLLGQPMQRSNVLASFKIPLGLSEAELIFTGERLDPQDFDALQDYVALFKKQYLRKESAAVDAALEKASEETAL